MPRDHSTSQPRFCQYCQKLLLYSQKYYCSYRCRNRAQFAKKFTQRAISLTHKGIPPDPLKEFDTLDDILGKL